MFRQDIKVLAENNTYQLIYNKSNNIISLGNKFNGLIELTAKFFHDTADGACLLSDFQYRISSESQQLAKLTADIVSDYLSRTQDKCKLFCIPGDLKNEFSHDAEYRSSQLERLMLRENEAINDIHALGEWKLEELNTNIDQKDMQQLIQLLKQTYWAKDVSESYVNKSLHTSMFVIARDTQRNIIGLVRYIHNNHFAYISDMVVDQDWRQKGIATDLMHTILSQIDSRFEFSALISAKEGDGKHAAPRLYGVKCGFIDYDQSHQHQVYFRYIRFDYQNNFESRVCMNTAGLLFYHQPKQGQCLFEMTSQSVSSKILM
ncbi:MAG: GNAT family N-acetyltransferase [Gammaproteobacteria bacterium]|nr:GNAT family N-acetyltransferase [Gammaproteobacteria bacterium]